MIRTPERSDEPHPGETGRAGSADPLIRRDDRVQIGSRQSLRLKRSLFHPHRSGHRRSAFTHRLALHRVQHDLRRGSDDPHPGEIGRTAPRETGRAGSADPLIRRDDRVQIGSRQSLRLKQSLFHPHRSGHRRSAFTHRHALHPVQHDLRRGSDDPHPREIGRTAPRRDRPRGEREPRYFRRSRNLSGFRNARMISRIRRFASARTRGSCFCS